MRVRYTVKFDLEKNQAVEWYKSEPGHLANITDGNNGENSTC
jgi:ribosomal protein S4E